MNACGVRYLDGFLDAWCFSLADFSSEAVVWKEGDRNIYVV